jgi:hypothetical protein
MSRAGLLLHVSSLMTCYRETILCPSLLNDFAWNILAYDYGFTQSFHKTALFAPLTKFYNPCPHVVGRESSVTHGQNYKHCRPESLANGQSDIRRAEPLIYV